ncbi:MAG: UDP-N-acetylglucosamine 2-epimerase [Gammaproteobacteria bacterium]|nr:UDP-N-acetylglucosamine 2-epimerase [Gammaproteobacteria bacterium]MCI0591179.1 UDP-N-acetylglucosamine 2-epimerase [Gammaproteobacteria bacterium]
MVKRKVCVVVNSRANYGRIKSVLNAIHERPDFELQLIVGASALLYRFGNVHELIRRDGFEPIATVYSIVEGETPTTMAKSTGMAIMELATQFENIKPDVVLTVADRFETMATAVAASYMNIPLAHVQGGEVTGSIDESVRHAVTKLSHIHFAATKRAADYLVRMGEDPAMVHYTGCPSIDIIADIDLTLSPNLFERYRGVGARIDPSKPYVVVLQHPVTTEYGCGFDQVNETLKAVMALGMQTAWLWPNVDAGSDDVSKGLRMYRERHNPDNLHFYRNFGVEDYARVIYNAACLIGNSSSALREGSFLGVPGVNIGTRQLGREHGENVVHVDYDAAEIEAVARFQINHGRYSSSDLFGDGKAGERIAAILADTDFCIQKRLHYVVGNPA